MPKIDDVPNSFFINDGKTRQLTVVVLNVEFAWALDDVVEVLDRNLNDVILGIVNDADERDPFLPGFDRPT